MATDPLAKVRNEIGVRIAELRAAGPRLSPLDMYAHIEAIRELAAINGLGALEALARFSGQLALVPGHKIAVSSALEHVDAALDSRSDSDCSTILAALAVRLH